MHNEPHYISIFFATIARITIPVQSGSSFDWVGRHRPNVVKSEKSKHSIIDIIGHKQSHEKIVYYLESNQNQIQKSPGTLFPPQTRDRKNYITSRLDPIGHQAVSRTLMANYRNLFNLFRFSDHLVDLTEPTAISKTCQRHPKTPRGTPEHGTSVVLCRRPWNFDVSSRVGEVVIDINPTCGVWRQNLVSRFQLKLYWTGQIGRKILHNGPRCIPKRSATIAKDNNTCSIRFILWLSR